MLRTFPFEALGLFACAGWILSHQASAFQVAGAMVLGAVAVRWVRVWLRELKG